MNNEDLAKDYIRRMQKEVTVLDSKLELYVHLIEKRIDRLDEINFAKSFFGIIYNSLLSDIIISTSRLFDGKRSGRNIIHFLDFVETNYNLFSLKSFNQRFKPSDTAKRFKHRKITYFSIKSHRKIINNKRAILLNLKTWRDKLYGHSDEEFFHSPEKLILVAPLKFNQIRSLILLAGKIINTYSLAFDGHYQIIRALNIFDVDNVLDAIKHYRDSLN